MRYDYSIEHMLRKSQITADALFYAPVAEAMVVNTLFEEKVKTFLGAIVQNLSATER